MKLYCITEILEVAGLILRRIAKDNVDNFVLVLIGEKQITPDMMTDDTVPPLVGVLFGELLPSSFLNPQHRAAVDARCCFLSKPVIKVCWDHALVSTMLKAAVAEVRCASHVIGNRISSSEPSIDGPSGISTPLGMLIVTVSDPLVSTRA